MKPMQTIDFFVKNEKVKSYRMIAGIFLLANIAAFAFLSFSEIYQTTAIASLLVILIFTLVRFLLYKKNLTKTWIDQWMYILPALCWAFLQFFIPVFICLLMAFLFLSSRKKLHFRVDENGIQKMNLPKQMYVWNLFSNVILKDNLLTLDFKNNHLIQVEVEPVLQMEESNFNKMVTEKIQSAIFDN
jgi:hypothetical protein